MARLDPLARDQLDPAGRALHDDMVATMRANEGGVAAVGDDGALVGPFVVLLRFPELGQGFWELSKRFTSSDRLPGRVREVAVLVVASSTDARFELYAHEIVGAEAGLSAAQVAALAAGEQPSGLDEAQEVAFLVARVLVAGRQLPESTYRLAIQRLGEDALAELVFLIGSFVSLAMLINAYDLPVPGRG